MVGLVLLKGVTYWKSLGNNTLYCRVVIRDFFTSIHIVLFIFNGLVVVFNGKSRNIEMEGSLRFTHNYFAGLG